MIENKHRPTCPTCGQLMTGDDDITIRDYFAAKAMQSLMTLEFYCDYPEEEMAEKAYKAADAMLAEREK